MKTYTAERPVTLYSGHVELTAEQARDRTHALAKDKVDRDGAGTYTITAPIQFKAGEVFGYDGDPGKNGGLAEAKREDIRRAKEKQDDADYARERREAAEAAGRDEQAQRASAAERDRQEREQAKARGEAHAKRDEK
jgi:hypothetical protein